jgi:hypothetical protein
VARLVVLLAAVAAAVSACGGAESISQEDGAQLALSRDRIVDAVETERRLHDAATADRLVARVRRIVASGSLEAKQLDEFGLAALGELRLAVPSLVLVDERGIPRELDREALRVFLANAERDPSAALERPAGGELHRIGELLGSAGAEAATEIPVAGQTAAAYLDGLETRLRPTWPELAAEVTDIRGQL